MSTHQHAVEIIVSGRPGVPTNVPGSCSTIFSFQNTPMALLLAIVNRDAQVHKISFIASGMRPSS